MRSIICGLALATAVASGRAEPLTEATRALEDGLPQVALHKLRQFSAPNQQSGEYVRAVVLQGRAEFASGDPGKAAATLEKLGERRGQEGDFWLAQSYASLQKPDRALPLYARLAGDKNFSFAAESRIGEARALALLGRNAEAAKLLQESVFTHPGVKNAAALDLAKILLDSGKFDEVEKTISEMKDPTPLQSARQNYILGCVALANGKGEQAQKLLSQVKAADPELASAAAVASAIADLRLGGIAGAERDLEKFIQEYPSHPSLGDVFATLDRVYASGDGASSADLRRWAESSEDSPRTQYALYYLARNEARLGKTPASLAIYESFLQKYPDHLLADSAREQVATARLNDGQLKEVLSLIGASTISPRLAFLRANALYARREYLPASQAFLTASSQGGELGEAALYNAAVCLMFSGVPEKKNGALQHMSKDPQMASRVQDFQLTSALHLAAMRDPLAPDHLLKIAENDDNPVRANRARLALSEWKYLQLDIPGAREELRQVSLNTPDSEGRAECLAIFLADTGDAAGETEAITRAVEFLEKFPNSPLEPEVRMKLGEIYFRRGDYASARVQFETLARDDADSPQADKALFLAAQSLARSMDKNSQEEAILLFEEVAKSGSVLGQNARLEQALLLNSLSRPKEAIAILDNILSTGQDADLRRTALIEKGNTYYRTGENDPSGYRKAIESWQGIVSEKNVPAPRRNQALCRMGAAYEKLGDRDAALACYYDVLSGNQSTEPDYFWYYKAGFDAGRLLESQKLWSEAIKVYDKMTALEGPRAEEARSRVNRLRLENFLWEE